MIITPFSTIAAIIVALTVSSKPVEPLKEDVKALRNGFTTPLHNFKNVR